MYWTLTREERASEMLWFKKTVNNVTLEAGKLYDVPITLICGADLDPEITPVAMIAYVGSQTGHDFRNSTSSSFLPIKDANVGSHGLAMALFDADGNKPYDGDDSNYGPHAVTHYQWKTSKGVKDNGDFQITTEADFGKQYDDDDKPTQPYTDGYLYTYVHCKLQTADNYPAFKAAYNYANICGFDPYTKGATPWYLPSAFQWKQMKDAITNYIKPKDYLGGDSDRYIIYACRGAFGAQLAYDYGNTVYWTSSEVDDNQAWGWKIVTGWSQTQKDVTGCVRAIFGF